MIAKQEENKNGNSFIIFCRFQQTIDDDDQNRGL